MTNKVVRLAIGKLGLMVRDVDEDAEMLRGGCE